MTTKAILLHQRGNVGANVIWVAPLPRIEQDALLPSIEAFRARGYWASAFPQGDGITLRHEEYDDTNCLEDVRSCFPWLSIDEVGQGQSVSQAMQRLNADRRLLIRYLVPAAKLLIYENIELGPYKIHRPVVPHENPTWKHPWADEFLDVPGADIDPGWNPVKAPENSLARLLGYPLIEGTIQVDARLLFPVGAGTAEWEPLALHVTEHADRALDVLRHRFCDYRAPHSTPHHAGVLSDPEFRIAYLMPDAADIKPHLIAAKPKVFEAVNVWLGLELDTSISPMDERLAEIASGIVANEIEERIRGALRARGQSFLLVSDEMRFVSMVFSTDAVSFVGKKRGDEHRRHVAAAASGNKRNLYVEFLDMMKTLYPLRNDIIHKGASFRELEMDAKDVLVKMDEMLRLCIENALACGFDSGSAWANAIAERAVRFEKS